MSTPSTTHTHPHATREPTTDSSVVGVDLGLQRLLVAAPPTDDPEIESALVVDGRPSWALFDELDERPNPPADVTERYADLIDSHLQLAADRFATYLDRHQPDAVAIEHLSYPDYDGLADAISSPADAGAYLIPAMRERVIETAHARDVSIADVARGRTSQECHVCGAPATKRRNYTLRCETDDCPGDGVCSDRAAAVAIAKRAAAASDALRVGDRREQ